MKTITLNGVEYVEKSSVQTLAEPVDGMEYVIVRTYSAGVFAGYIKRRDGQEVELINARRLWYWDGAASLSQLSIDGVSKPDKCKFPAPVSSVTILQAIEILPVTAKAKQSIATVEEWSE